MLDGTSNCFLFGETIGSRRVAGSTLQQTKQIEYSHSWMGTGALPTAWGLRFTGNPPQYQTHNWYQFSSEHPGGVLFVYADGSVRNVSWQVNGTVFRNVSGMADGTTASIDN